VKRIKYKVIRILTVPFLLFFLWAGWTRFSIRQDSVEFRSGSLIIRGTLLSPRFRNKDPGVVLVHGSGETSRKSMMVYAWIFASRGYAALAYDKRGVGQSDGKANEWREFSIDDLASDASAGYFFLQSLSNVNSGRVGFFGVSQGGWVVALAASRLNTPAFLIMASASLSTVAEDRIYGREAQIRHAGYGEDAVDHAKNLIALDHQVTRSGEGYVQLMAAWNHYSKEAWFGEVYQDTVPLPVNDLHREWERKVLDFDPQPLLLEIKSPVLWIFGDPALDRFSPVKLSISRVKQAQAAGKPYEILQIDKVGHTLEPEDGGGLKSFLQIRIPLLWRIFQWLDTQAKPFN
jgi:pimeloyl-ACP methyl ester carboxylesterase